MSSLIQPFMDTPVNALLLLPIAYLTFSILFPDVETPKKPATAWREGYSWRPQSHPQTLLFLKYTPKTLQLWNGKDKPRILLAIDRKVFDVTAGGSFYGPGGPYGNFAGRDASRGMAKQSFDTDMLTPVDQPLDTLADITKDERENMDSWVQHFSNKYIVCGELVENDD
ncbi:hypothetical protein FRB93_007583 [Tulasnella sp. JGI-2019a]|nr:hypothetical protein FRB93_007583 [Tulasnella sp. JGI-2019a]